MQEPGSTNDPRDYLAPAIETSIRLGVIALLVIWCVYIIRPFIIPAIWGIIIATAIFPVFAQLAKALGGRSRTAAGLLTTFGVALLIVPAVLFAGSLVDSGQWLATELDQGTLEIPAAPEAVRGWPIVGERLYGYWDLANKNLEGALQQLGPQLAYVGSGVLSTAAGLGMALLQFIISVVVAGVLLANANGAVSVANNIAVRLADERGAELLKVAGATVRSVATGILGVALIQASLLTIGLVVAGVPHAPLWGLILLFLAVVQLPLLLAVVPFIVYVFSASSTTGAIVFTVWTVAAAVSDNVLKPMLLSRGLDLPTLVIFMGAIGGFITSGFVGLFVGAVIVALGYMLFMAWLDEPVAETTQRSGAGEHAET